MEKLELVIIPAPGMGHLVSTVELAKRLLDLCCGFSITVLVIKPPFVATIGDYTKTIAASDPRIRYIELPRVDPPSPDLYKSSVEKYISVFIESHKSHVKDTISNLVSTESVRLVGVVVDLFCTSMIDVAHELGVPSYLYFTSGAAFLGLMLHLPTRPGQEFKESDPDSIIPSYINPVPSNCLPSFAFNKEGYSAFSDHARKFKEMKGIIINTFLELESHAVESLMNDQTPPIYTVGPLLDLKCTSHSELNRTHRDEIIQWLDDQPPSSVVFLCFGSMGSFGGPQLKEIALGLEQSGHRFLWSVRQPPPPDKGGMPSDYTNLDEILPSGFLERTNGRGMLCGWAPQVEVLAHPSVGGFVSHCGWNSILESVWFGVPIVTWPIYAEQQINAFEMVKELGLAVELKLDYRRENDVVMAAEIERALRCLMNDDKKVREKVKEMADRSRMVVMEGGSSLTSLGRLIKDVLKNNS